MFWLTTIRPHPRTRATVTLAARVAAKTWSPTPRRTTWWPIIVTEAVTAPWTTARSWTIIAQSSLTATLGTYNFFKKRTFSFNYLLLFYDFFVYYDFVHHRIINDREKKLLADTISLFGGLNNRARNVGSSFYHQGSSTVAADSGRDSAISDSYSSLNSWPTPEHLPSNSRPASGNVERRRRRLPEIPKSKKCK